MIKYKLAKIATGSGTGRAKGSVVTLDPVTFTAGGMLQYRKLLRGIVREIAAGVREDVLPAYRSYRKYAGRFGADAVQDEPTWFLRIRAKLETLTRAVGGMVGGILSAEVTRNTSAFKAAVKKALGIDLGAVVRDEDLDDYLRNAVERNVALIKGMTDDSLAKIERLVYDAKIGGQSARDLQKALQKQISLTVKRADLIASDQMAKVTADLNMIRHQQAGITEYEWLTSRDERVRSRHRRISGTVYKYGEATGAEEGLPPGKPIRCRCVALARVEF